MPAICGDANLVSHGPTRSAAMAGDSLSGYAAVYARVTGGWHTCTCNDGSTYECKSNRGDGAGCCDRSMPAICGEGEKQITDKKAYFDKLHDAAFRECSALAAEMGAMHTTHPFPVGSRSNQAQTLASVGSCFGVPASEEIIDATVAMGHPGQCVDGLLQQSACQLTGGEWVSPAWVGPDTGNNFCNSCTCQDGTLACSKLACTKGDRDASGDRIVTKQQDTPTKHCSITCNANSPPHHVGEVTCEGPCDASTTSCSACLGAEYSSGGASNGKVAQDSGTISTLIDLSSFTEATFDASALLSVHEAAAEEFGVAITDVVVEVVRGGVDRRRLGAVFGGIKVKITVAAAAAKFDAVKTRMTQISTVGVSKLAFGNRIDTKLVDNGASVTSTTVLGASPWADEQVTRSYGDAAGAPAPEQQIVYLRDPNCEKELTAATCTLENDNIFGNRISVSHNKHMCRMTAPGTCTCDQHTDTITPGQSEGHISTVVGN